MEGDKDFQMRDHIRAIFHLLRHLHCTDDSLKIALEGTAVYSPEAKQKKTKSSKSSSKSPTPTTSTTSSPPPSSLQSPPVPVRRSSPGSTSSSPSLGISSENFPKSELLWNVEENTVWRYHGSSRHHSMKGLSPDQWYLIFTESYQGMYLGPISKKLNRKVGEITIKNIGSRALVLSSYSVKNKTISISKPGMNLFVAFSFFVCSFVRSFVCEFVNPVVSRLFVSLVS